MKSGYTRTYTYCAYIYVHVWAQLHRELYKAALHNKDIVFSKDTVHIETQIHGKAPEI